MKTNLSGIGALLLAALSFSDKSRAEFTVHEWGTLTTLSDASGNPVAADAVAASLMGFDWRSIPVIARGFVGSPYALTDCPPDQVQLGTTSGTAGLASLPAAWVTSCREHFGWQGHISAAAFSHDDL